jgi:hypothetical protein
MLRTAQLRLSLKRRLNPRKNSPCVGGMTFGVQAQPSFSSHTMLVYQRVSDHESSSLSSVSDSNLYILQYRRQAELGCLTLAQEKQVGLKAADGICKQRAGQLLRV